MIALPDLYLELMFGELPDNALLEAVDGDAGARASELVR